MRKGAPNKGRWAMIDMTIDARVKIDFMSRRRGWRITKS